MSVENIKVIKDAVLLVEHASRNGVFKLNNFMVVGDLHQKCVQAVKNNDFSQLDVDTLALLVNILKFSSNSNGFDISLFKAVATIIDSLERYIKSKAQSEEEEGVDESKQED
jgi:hypothetical protein